MGLNTFPAQWLKKGTRNLITDVPGVKVGHFTYSQGEIQTGITAILPHDGNLFQHKVEAACHVINGYGKSVGLMQIAELGSIETPILLTNTFGVPACITALLQNAMAQNPLIGDTDGTVNSVVLECNDGYLNDLRQMALTPEHGAIALAAAGETFAQGAVGAGRGMACYHLKGGIGSASRIMEVDGVSYVLGTLVLTNFGRTKDLCIQGDPVGLRLDEPLPKSETMGSVIIVIATDLPLDSRQLGRLSRRVQSGLARTGAYVEGGSGEVVVAFSTANVLQHHLPQGYVVEKKILHESALEDGYLAVTQCVEESVCRALAYAETVAGCKGHIRYSLKDTLARRGEPSPFEETQLVQKIQENA